MTHHLILFYGSSSGAGKTTPSDWLQRHLEQQAIPVEWIEEDEVQHLDIFSPVVQAFEHGQGDPIVTSLDAARQLVERYQLSDKIVIMDSIFPSYTWLYAAGVSLSQAAQFNQQLAGILAPLKPVIWQIMNHIQLLNYALELIDGCHGAALSPTTLAERCGYSRSHFDGLFMRTVGESLGSYIRRRRLDWAAEALVCGRQRIIEIALDAGFDSQEAFTRAFQRRYGRTPGEYRHIGQPRALWPQLSVQPHAKWAGRMRLIMVWHSRPN